MPPLFGKDGRPLTMRKGSDIPFTNSEEARWFSKVLDTVTEYNVRSKRRILLCVAGSDGNVTLAGNTRLVQAAAACQIGNAITKSVEHDDWVMDKKTWLVPLFSPPSKNDMDSLDEDGAETVISMLLGAWNYPHSHHFSSGASSGSVSFWPECVPRVPPSQLAIIHFDKMSRDLFGFTRRLEMLKFVLHCLFTTYFYKLLYKLVGVSVNADGEYSCDETFSTKLPFDYKRFEAHCATPLPIKQKTVFDTKRKRKRGDKKLGVPGPSVSPSCSNEDSTVEGMEKSKLIFVRTDSIGSAATPRPTVDMPSLPRFDGQFPKKDPDEVTGENGEPFEPNTKITLLCVPDKNGTISASILCSCPVKPRGRVTTVRCQKCTKKVHTSCAYLFNRKPICLLCKRDSTE